MVSVNGVATHGCAHICGSPCFPQVPGPFAEALRLGHTLGVPVSETASWAPQQLPVLHSHPCGPQTHRVVGGFGMGPRPGVAPGPPGDRVAGQQVEYSRTSAMSPPHRLDLAQALPLQPVPRCPGCPGTGHGGARHLKQVRPPPKPQLPQLCARHDRGPHRPAKCSQAPGRPPESWRSGCDLPPGLWPLRSFKCFNLTPKPAFDTKAFFPLGFVFFFKRIYLCIFREGKGGRKRERNIDVW